MNPRHPFVNGSAWVFSVCLQSLLFPIYTNFCSCLIALYCLPPSSFLSLKLFSLKLKIVAFSFFLRGGEFNKRYWLYKEKVLFITIRVFLRFSCLLADFLPCLTYHCETAFSITSQFSSSNCVVSNLTCFFPRNDLNCLRDSQVGGFLPSPKTHGFSL